MAVLNTDRTRDFTPTCSAARRDGTICPYDKPAGGGAEQFHRFLIEELRLEVEIKFLPTVQTFLSDIHTQVYLPYRHCQIIPSLLTRI